MLRMRVHRLLQRLGWEVHRVRRPPGSLVHVVRLIDRESIKVVLDVGANCGQFGCELRRSGYSGRIVSFEPLSAAHRELQETVVGDPAWTAAPCMALGNQDGEVVINVSAFMPASSLLQPSDNLVDMLPAAAASTRETVRCRRLDNVVEEYVRPGERVLLKLDVQGFEKQVLEGAEFLLPNISGIYIEVSVVPLYDGQALAPEILDYLHRLGFEVWYMTPGYVDTRTGRMLQYDVLLARAEHRRVD
jgi:FkbM family methyltransferase